jgi:hypothetical protein
VSIRTLDGSPRFVLDRTCKLRNRVFSAQNDARAHCFVWLLCADNDRSSLRRSVEMGYAYAFALFAGGNEGEERFKFAQLAAAQGEPDGLFLLGTCFRDGQGCEKDLDKAREIFFRASQLGDVSALFELGWLCGASNPQRWVWLGRAADLGAWVDFLSNFAKQVELFNSGSGSAVVMFAIGQALQGHVNEEAGMIFNSNINFDSLVGPAKQAIAFYEAQINATKCAMHAWTQVGTRWKVVKDVRKLIAKLIWDSREEALYKT